jgi:hypothetical protein
MRHARVETLVELGDLLAAIRKTPGVIERKSGVFYRRGQAFLHFHEDPAGLFADLRIAGDWQRFPVNSDVERERLLGALREA